MVRRAGELLISIIQEFGGTVTTDDWGGNTPEDSVGQVVYDALYYNLETSIVKVYNSKNKYNFKVRSTDSVQEGHAYTFYHEDTVDYWVNTEYPNVVGFLSAGKLDPREIADNIAEGLKFDVEDAHIRKKAAHAPSFLKFVGNDFLKWLLKEMAADIDLPLLEDSPIPEEVEEFAYEKTDIDWGVSDGYEEYEGKVPYPKVRVEAWAYKVFPKISFRKPWVFLLDFSIPIKYETLTADDRRYDDYM